MALPLLLLLLLALTALGHGTLLLARGELHATWAFRHAVRAEKAAEAAIQMGLGEKDALGGERVPWVGISLAGGESEDGLIFRSTLRWLDREYFLVEGSGGSRGWEGERRQAWVGWSLDPVVRVGALLAGGELGGGLSREAGSVLESGGFFEAPEGWSPEICEGYRAVLDSLFPGGPPLPIGPLSEPEPAGTESGTSIPTLGLLSGFELLERAGSGGLSAVLPGGPDQGCPSGGQPVFHGEEGSAVLVGGRSCGLLVVEGDLLLEGDARFQGLALVGGKLEVEGEASFEGMVRVRGGVRMGPGAEFQARSCPVLWALQNLPELLEPVMLPHARKLSGY